jgi:hypothetical protein
MKSTEREEDRGEGGREGRGRKRGEREEEKLNCFEKKRLGGPAS